MAANDRLALFPSRANLVATKLRIVAGQRGLNLLKRKRDALEMKLRQLRAELRTNAELINSAMQEAYLAMARANYFGTDFKPASVMSTDRADAYLRIRSNKVAGLQLPTFELILRAPTCFPLTGLSRGGNQVEIVREKFQEALRVLIKLASLEFSVRVLSEGVRQNNMRINGLDYVVIPRFINTVNYIRDELDEYEREDFYRLKRSQAKQRQAKAKFAMMLKLKHMTPEELAMLKRRGIRIPSVIDEKFNMNEFDENVRRSTLAARYEQLLAPVKVEVGTQTSQTWNEKSFFSLWGEDLNNNDSDLDKDSNIINDNKSNVTDNDKTDDKTDDKNIDKVNDAVNDKVIDKVDDEAKGKVIDKVNDRDNKNLKDKKSDAKRKDEKPPLSQMHTQTSFSMYSVSEELLPK